MSAVSGEKAAAVPRQPGGTPDGAAFIFNLHWPSGKPEDNA
jgi:hypothetical protein